MSITKRYFGKTSGGSDVDIFKLTNSKGVEVEITNYGGIVVSLKVPDNKGKFDDVVLGFDDMEGYHNNKAFFGAAIGRVANRIGKAHFTLNGVEYNLVKNDGLNHLHGGELGFDKVVWNAEITNSNGEDALELYYKSIDGEENYPGNLDVKITYTLTEDNGLKIDYYAVSDKDTIVNLTNHSYFNLSGHDSGDILKHKLTINSDKITVNDSESIPTGEFREVKGTPMDFTDLKAIGSEIDSDYDQIVYAGGYDHNWALNVSGKEAEKAAIVVDDSSGRVMEVFTTKPGVQLYTGNYLDGSLIGKNGTAYGKRSALCLETQYFPDAINHENFPSPILKAGDEYKHTTIYKFTVK